MSIIYTHYYFIQDILMVPVRKPIRDNPKIYFSQNPKKFFLSQCFLEIILKQFIKSKKLVQVLIKLLHPQNFLQFWSCLQIQESSSSPDQKNEKKYIFVTCYLRQQSASVRGFPLYLSFQHGGRT